ncbi:MAG: amino acid permease [Bdellovibrionales bacterium]
MAITFFRKKSISDITESATEDEGLKRSLSATDLIMLGVGGTIGAGIFVLTGQAAANHAGPAIILSFVLAGIAAGLAAYCYAELASMIPAAGSAYTYAYVSFGELVAWMIGWLLILELSFGAAAVAIGWSGYVKSFLAGFGFEMPAMWASSMFVDEGGGFNILAALNILAVSAILYRGMKVSSVVNSIIVVVKVAVILMFVFAAGAYVDPAHYEPFMPFGFSGAVTGAAVVFFAYLGFDIVATTAQEAKNPQRDMAKGILGSLAICTVLYLAVAAVLVGVIPYAELNVAAPIAKALDHLNLSQLSPYIKIGAIAGLTTAIMGLLIGQNRIFYAMGRDGLLPKWTASVHKRFHSPHKTTAAVAVLVALMSGLLPIHALAELVSIGTLFAFTIVCGGVFWLRYKQPNQARGFKAPFFPYLPIAGVLVNIYLMIGLPFITWTYFLIWSGIGLVVYFAYSARHSKLNRKA